MNDAARIVAGAIRKGAKRHAERHGRGYARGTVLTTSPLTVDLHGTDLVLDTDDLDFSKTVDPDDIEKDDVLVLLEVGEGDWIVVSAF